MSEKYITLPKIDRLHKSLLDKNAIEVYEETINRMLHTIDNSIDGNSKCVQSSIREASEMASKNGSVVTVLKQDK